MFNQQCISMNKLPEVTFPSLIWWKTADIPSLGLEDEAWDDWELNREADGGGGAAGAAGAEAFDGA